jgi:cell division protein FtsN
MPRDYANKKSAPKKSRGASRSKSKPAAPAALWFFTGALVVALAAGLAYLKWLQPQNVTPINNASNTVAKVQPKAVNPSEPKADEADEVPFYEVHRDLTNKKVEIPKEDLQLPDDYKKYYYTMPCGAFRDPARADELKAMIAMTGSASNVSSVQSKGETWYRVQLGPFDSKRTAEKIRHQLQDNGIQECNINRHIKPD